ncbi:MAG: ribonuclease P protein component [Puniceicoccales bacterium]|jgi:ribonuclease P protein component|nr:ribonuclease P protein component [Puniceicoccales bacterium]
MEFRFLRSQRIRSRVDFHLFRLSRLREKGLGFLLVQKENAGEQSLPRLALVASRKVGNAVRRNHLRRFFREKFRHVAKEFLCGSDFLVVFLVESKEMDPRAMRDDFARRLQRMSAAGKSKGRRS